MCVIGIDLGLCNMGWGVIEVNGFWLFYVVNGVCKLDGGVELVEWLLDLYW